MGITCSCVTKETFSGNSRFTVDERFIHPSPPEITDVIGSRILIPSNVAIKFCVEPIGRF